MRGPLSLSLALVIAGCAAPSPARVDAQPQPETPAASAEAPSPAAGPLVASREGSTVARAPEDDVLYVADEDHTALRVLALPVDARRVAEIALPGRPAQVLALRGRVLVTVRDPGLLLVLRRDRAAGLVEEKRISLPADAWGVAVDAEGRRAVVSSAFSHKLSGIDLEKLEVTFTVDVAREPRGVTVAADGKAAYVSHLVGPSLTKLSFGDDPSPSVSRVSLPASPLRELPGADLDASLGYAVTLSEDGSRLFAARHALGATGPRSWFGGATVDVLRTRDDTALMPRRRSAPQVARNSEYFLENAEHDHGLVPMGGSATLTQPRAMVYRKSQRTLLVASEGTNTLAELDATALDPTFAPRRTHTLARRFDFVNGVPGFCGAPSGIALSADEATAYVFCRSTYDLAIVHLGTETEAPAAGVAGLSLAADPGGPEVSVGRRMFYDAVDETTSGGLACAGCHPEGRDDGHTWHEVKSPVTQHPIFVAAAHQVSGMNGEAAGAPRQTPMIAGRLEHPGPYGWRAQSRDLAARAIEGFALHRWDGQFGPDENPTTRMRARPLAAFLRSSLVPPPREQRPLTAQEARGRELFMSEATGCATCHDPARAYSDFTAEPLKPLPTRKGFEDDETDAFKTPSLLFVGGSAPYYHDGSVRTLAELIDLNDDRMGKTNHLSKADRAALVAFLETL